MTRRASCSCDRLSLVCEGEPTRVSICHCLACQRRTGSAFGIQARFPRERVRIEGASSTFDRAGDDGGRATFHFCPACGATVYYEADWMPGHVGIPVGAFADPSFPAPTVGVYANRKHPWAEMPGLALDHDE